SPSPTMTCNKTFSRPRGGAVRAPGGGGVGERLLPFLPIPIVGRDGDRYRWLDAQDLPQTIGRLSAFMGNAGVLLSAYAYMRMLGRARMPTVVQSAALNANDMLAGLQQAGFDAAYPGRRASHEFII